MQTAVLLLGTNTGKRMEMLEEAGKRLELIGRVEHLSSIYETAPWGNTDQPAFLNQVVVLNTDLSAQTLMQSLLAIEEAMGRQRIMKWEPRIIDIDLLFYNDHVINEDHLIVPHPLLHVRKFTLAPLNELMPAYVHPVLMKSMHELYITCNDDSEVHVFNG